MSQHAEPAAKILLVGAALLVLAGVSLLLSFVGLGGWGIPVALAIAGVKGYVVVHFYMELDRSHWSVRIVAVVALLFVLLLVVLTAADPATRFEPPLLPPPAPAP